VPRIDLIDYLSASNYTLLKVYEKQVPDEKTWLD